MVTVPLTRTMLFCGTRGTAIVPIGTPRVSGLGERKTPTSDGGASALLGEPGARLNGSASELAPRLRTSTVIVSGPP
jgi:hypothetical protein